MDCHGHTQSNTSLLLTKFQKIDDKEVVLRKFSSKCVRTGEPKILPYSLKRIHACNHNNHRSHCQFLSTHFPSISTSIQRLEFSKPSFWKKFCEENFHIFETKKIFNELIIENNSKIEQNFVWDFEIPKPMNIRVFALMIGFTSCCCIACVGQTQNALLFHDSPLVEEGWWSCFSVVWNCCDFFL